MPTIHKLRQQAADEFARLGLDFPVRPLTRRDVGNVLYWLWATSNFSCYQLSRGYTPANAPATQENVKYSLMTLHVLQDLLADLVREKSVSGHYIAEANLAMGWSPEEVAAAQVSDDLVANTMTQAIASAHASGTVEPAPELHTELL